MRDFLKSTITLPFAYEQHLEDGARVDQHNICRTCIKKDCLEVEKTTNEYFECAKGFSCIPLRFMGQSVLLNGLIHYPQNLNFQGKKRKPYREYIVTKEDVDFFKSSLKETEAFIKKKENDSAKDSVSSLHDVVTSLLLVNKWCHKVIDNREGENFESKLRGVDKDTYSLFTSITLLQKQLDLMHMIVNPASITYGKKHRFDLHGFLFKLTRLFELSAAEKKCTISLRGTIDGFIEAYNSFEYLPLILLNNAVKYSTRNSNIIVYVKEYDKEILFSVSSYGHMVPADERAKIFEKYYRGSNVKKENPNGIGLGLYLAQLIAEANNTKIIYSCTAEGVVGNNEFFLNMKKVK